MANNDDQPGGSAELEQLKTMVLQQQKMMVFMEQQSKVNQVLMGIIVGTTQEARVVAAPVREGTLQACTAEACDISINTLTTIKKRFNEAEIENQLIQCLKKLLPAIGFSFKKDDGRRGLFELEHIAAKRVQFLKEYIKNKDLEEYDPVYLDGTKSIKKKPMGEGKR
ncbi:hypothetical protein FQA39_LY02097 [Lamprigera yunnana]|nr:hypothetical protein FQA39_LY02097 [Lamprigera yunnana]